MANTYTTRLNLTKPEVGADTNAWGGHLNANLDTIDSNIVSLSIATTQTMTGALALPSNGLNVGSGQLNVTGGNVSMSGNASAVNGTFSGTLGVTGASTLTGNTSVGGTLGVTGAATLSSTLSVTGATTLASNGLNVGSGQLQVTGGNVNMSGALNVTGACASGNNTVNGTLNVTGATTLASNGLNVGSGQLQVIGGNVTTSGSITSSGNLSGVNGSLSGTLGVTGAATFSSTMSIAGLVTASTAPTLGGHLTNKTYVDGQDALQLNLSGGTMTGNIVFAGTQPTATTTTAAIVQLTDSIASTSVTTAATPNSVKTAYDLANAALPRSGGTMTGMLTLSAAPTVNLHAATKKYVDDAVSASSGGLPTTGGTMTGILTFAATQPTATTVAPNIVLLTDSIASTSVTTAATPNSVKTAYDLANAALPKAGGTMTGALALPANGLNVGSGQLNVTGGNVSSSGNISGVNGSFSGTLGVTGAATLSSTLAVTGAATFSSTMSVSGLVTASTAPTLGGHLTNKTYVDGQNALKLDLSGGTLTGALTLAADPVSSLQPVTRQFFYARSVATGTGLTGGGDLSANRTISISSGGVSATELASNAVTTVKITDANVTPAKLSQPFTMATEVSTATGTTASFTSIPSWVNRIIIMLNNVGTTAGADIFVRIGPSGGVETTGYSSAVSYGGSSVNVTNSSTFSFLVPGVGSGNNGSYQFNGHAILTRISGNTWIMSSNIISTTTNSYYSSASRKTLAGSLSVLSVITAGTFAQGSVNITYE